MQVKVLKQAGKGDSSGKDLNSYKKVKKENLLVIIA